MDEFQFDELLDHLKDTQDYHEAMFEGMDGLISSVSDIASNLDNFAEYFRKKLETKENKNLNEKGLELPDRNSFKSQDLESREKFHKSLLSSINDLVFYSNYNATTIDSINSIVDEFSLKNILLKSENTLARYYSDYSENHSEKVKEAKQDRFNLQQKSINRIIDQFDMLLGVNQKSDTERIIESIQNINVVSKLANEDAERITNIGKPSEMNDNPNKENNFTINSKAIFSKMEGFFNTLKQDSEKIFNNTADKINSIRKESNISEIISENKNQGNLKKSSDENPIFISPLLEIKSILSKISSDLQSIIIAKKEEMDRPSVVSKVIPFLSQSFDKLRDAYNNKESMEKELSLSMDSINHIQEIGKENKISKDLKEDNSSSSLLVIVGNIEKSLKSFVDQYVTNDRLVYSNLLDGIKSSVIKFNKDFLISNESFVDKLSLSSNLTEADVLKSQSNIVNEIAKKIELENQKEQNIQFDISSMSGLISPIIKEIKNQTDSVDVIFMELGNITSAISRIPQKLSELLSGVLSRFNRLQKTIDYTKNLEDISNNLSSLKRHNVDENLMSNNPISFNYNNKLDEIIRLLSPESESGKIVTSSSIAIPQIIQMESPIIPNNENNKFPIELVTSMSNSLNVIGHNISDINDLDNAWSIRNSLMQSGSNLFNILKIIEDKQHDTTTNDHLQQLNEKIAILANATAAQSAIQMQSMSTQGSGGIDTLSIISVNVETIKDKFIALLTVLKSKKFSVNSSQIKDKKTEIEKETKKGESSEINESLRLMTTFGANVNNIIKSFLSVNKTYVRKVTIFQRSIDSVLRTFKKNFGGDDAQKVMVSANVFTNFLKNYVSTISGIDMSALKSNKIKRVIETFDMFKELKASEADIEKASKIGETMIVFAQNVEQFMKVLRRTKSPSTVQIKKITTSIRDFVKDIGNTLKSADIKRAKDVSEVLDGIGRGVLKFAKRMFWAGPIMVLATPGLIMFKLVMKFLMPEFNYLAKNGLKIREGAKALQSLGWGVLLFTTSLFLSSKLMAKMGSIESVAGVLGILAVGYTFTKFFSMLGKERRNVRQGVGTIAFLALGTMMMVATLYLLSITKLNYQAVGGAILCVGGLTAMFMLLGKRHVARNIAVGAGAIALMGLSLMLLIYPLTAFSAMLSENSDVLWKLPVLLAGVGLIYFFAGKAAKDIAFGSLAFATVGLSLMLLQKPLSSIAKTLHDNGDVLWKLPVFLAGMGLVYSLAGLAIGFIIPGAIAVATIGASLWTLFHPLGKIAPVLKQNGDVLWKLPTFLTAAGLAYSILGPLSPLIAAGSIAVLAIGGSMNALTKPLEMISKTSINHDQVMNYMESAKTMIKGYATMLKDVSFFDLPAIFTVNQIADSMATLGKGISSWKELISGWSDQDTIIMTNLISGATSSMVVSTSPEWIKKQYGIEVTKLGMWSGIKATMELGNNLKTLGEGVKFWRDMQITEDDAKTITNSIDLMLSVLPYSIAKVGKMYDSDSFSNLWGLFDSKDDDVEKQKKFQYMNGEIYSLRELKLGLKYSKQIGDVLQSLAKGVKYWKEATITTPDIQLIIANVDNILQTLPAAIAKVGAASHEVENTGFLGMWKKTDTSLGIKYAKGIGDVLQSLANGVKYWKEAKLEPDEIKTIVSNVDNILQTLPAAIAKIGNEDGDIKNVGFLGLWSKTDTQRGIDYAKGMGTVMKDLADGVKYWAEAKLEPDEITSITKNVTDIITALPKVFAEIGRSKDNDKGFWGMFKSDAEKGIKIVDKLNKPFGNLSDIISKFNSIPDPSERARLIGEGVKSLLKNTVDGFLTLSPAKVELFGKFIDPFRKFADILIKLNKSIKEVGNVNWREIEPIIEKAGMMESNKILAESNAKIAYEDAKSKRQNTTATSTFGFGTHVAVATPKATVKDVKKEEKATISNEMLYEMFMKLNSTLEGIVTSNGSVKKEVQDIKKMFNFESGRLKVDMQ